MKRFVAFPVPVAGLPIGLLIVKLKNVKQS